MPSRATASACDVCRKAGTLRRDVKSIVQRGRDDPAPFMCTYPPIGDTYSLRWSTVQSVLATFVPEELVSVRHRVVGYTEHAHHVTVHFKVVCACCLLVCEQIVPFVPHGCLTRSTAHIPHSSSACRISRM
jgi:hypothetical protein